MCSDIYALLFLIHIWILGCRRVPRFKKPVYKRSLTLTSLHTQRDRSRTEPYRRTIEMCVCNSVFYRHRVFLLLFISFLSLSFSFAPSSTTTRFFFIRSIVCFKWLKHFAICIQIQRFNVGFRLSRCMNWEIVYFVLCIRLLSFVVVVAWHREIYIIWL